MSTTTEPIGTAESADYSGMDNVQTLAAAAADPQGFEAAIAQALAQENAPQAAPQTVAETAPQTAPETAPEKPPSNEASRFTPDIENQLRALQQSFAQREQENAALAGQIEQLRSQLQGEKQSHSPEKESNTAAPAFQVDPTIFGDLSETAIAKGMEQVVNTIIPQLRQEMREQAQQISPSAGRGFTGWATDVGAAALQGAMAAPEFAVGLADIPTAGYAGKAVQTLGLDFAHAKEIAEGWKSEQYHAARRKFEEADGFGAKLGAAVDHPSLVADAVVQPAPSMLGGAVAARGMGLMAILFI